MTVIRKIATPEQLVTLNKPIPDPTTKSYEDWTKELHDVALELESAIKTKIEEEEAKYQLKKAPTLNGKKRVTYPYVSALQGRMVAVNRASKQKILDF